MNADAPARSTIVSLVAAVAANGVIGRRGAMPWRIPDDMARFRKITMGHALIMGRATFESMGRPLAGRLNIVLTRDEARHFPGCTMAHDRDSALHAAGQDVEVFVIGGSSVYRLFLPVADRLIITWVDAEVDGDASFPDVRWDEWEARSETVAASVPGVLPHRFADYERKTT
jgi:dihydrofolate reductase